MIGTQTLPYPKQEKIERYIPGCFREQHDSKTKSAWHEWGVRGIDVGELERKKERRVRIEGARAKQDKMICAQRSKTKIALIWDVTLRSTVVPRAVVGRWSTVARKRRSRVNKLARGVTDWAWRPREVLSSGGNRVLVYVLIVWWRSKLK